MKFCTVHVGSAYEKDLECNKMCQLVGSTTQLLACKISEIFGLETYYQLLELV